mmetsp:Transcript_35091/g.59080  ORF Transcript_35091/g.59080 Transcript_35091/m.59080 type:complete len:241 (-) Transcript_35091:409-1131(-)
MARWRSDRPRFPKALAAWRPRAQLNAPLCLQTPFSDPSMQGGLMCSRLGSTCTKPGRPLTITTTAATRCWRKPHARWITTTSVSRTSISSRSSSWRLGTPSSRCARTTRARRGRQAVCSLGLSRATRCASCSCCTTPRLRLRGWCPSSTAEWRGSAAGPCPAPSAPPPMTPSASDSTGGLTRPLVTNPQPPWPSPSSRPSPLMHWTLRSLRTRPSTQSSAQTSPPLWLPRLRSRPPRWRL